MRNTASSPNIAPVVTLMAVIGAYMGADGLHASGFMAVFVFGIMLGNQESLGFRRARTARSSSSRISS